MPVALVGHVSGEGDVDDARGYAKLMLMLFKHKPYYFLLGNNWTRGQVPSVS